MPALKFGSARTEPGSKSFGFVTVVGKHRKTRLPVAVINGQAEGPKMVFIANQHGREAVGIEVLRRFCHAVRPARLSGSVICVLSCNPEATLCDWDCLPEFQGQKGGDAYESRNNLNFSWTLNRAGLLSERVTSRIWEEAVVAGGVKPALFVDLHCHSNPTAVYAEDKLAVDIGIVSGICHVICTRAADAAAAGRPSRATSNLLCRRHRIPSITVEFNDSNSLITNEVVKEGLRAIDNILKFYGCLKGKPVYSGKTQLIDAWYSHFVTNRKSIRDSYQDLKAAKAGVCVVYRSKYAASERETGLLTSLTPGA